MAKAQSQSVVAFLFKLDNDDIDVVYELTKLTEEELEELSEHLTARRRKDLEN